MPSKEMLGRSVITKIVASLPSAPKRIPDRRIRRIILISDMIEFPRLR